MPAGAQPARGVLRLEEARRALDALAGELRQRGEASELFARDRGEGLAAILGNIGQTTADYLTQQLSWGEIHNLWYPS